MVEPRATWALVTTTPSRDQIIPEPLPRPAPTRTVERRSCSAISPNPGMATLLASVRAFCHHQARFLHSAAANEFQSQRFADRAAVELRVDVFQPRYRMAAERDEDIANDDSRLMCGAFRFHLQDNGRGLFAMLQRLTKGLG